MGLTLQLEAHPNTSEEQSMSMAEVPPFKRPRAEAPTAQLESRLAALAEGLRRLEARVAALESGAPEPIRLLETTPPTGALPDALPSPVRIMGLLGRVCLILGGATFIRALVDAGTIHRGWGVALGLAYAITWALLADRAKTHMDATFHVLASILIAYPLIAESTLRFGILTPPLAATALLAVVTLHGVVAWRRDLQPMAWIATLASLAMGFVLLAGRQAVEPFLVVFLIMGLGTLWLTRERRWPGLRWPTAFGADLGVLILTTLAAWPRGPPEAYRGLSPAWAMGLALTLAMLYIGSFAWRMLQRRQRVNAFELVQTALVLLVGFGGAVRVAVASGSGAGPLGAGICLAGIGCYAGAAPFAADQDETRSNFNFFTTLALVFLLLGGLILLRAPLFATVSGGLGLIAMLAGLRLRRAVLVLHSGIYLTAAFVTAGLAASSLGAFLDPSGPIKPPSLASLLALAALSTVLAAFLLHRPPEAVTRRIRPVILILGAMAAAGWGSLMIWSCCNVFPARAGDAGALAAVRTGVLSALSIALAWLGRRLPVLELRWLVYPLLVVTALKFLFEDMAAGRPLPLFLGFMCFGATLIFAPRLLKTPAPSDGLSPDRNPG
jgi:hypothetical protein